MLLVPRDSPGLEVRRGLSIMGYWDETHGGHAEVVFDDVRVGQDAVLGEQGKGFALAQARLGPGRIHHCMRLVGMAERAFELMCQRADERIAFGKPLAKQGVVIDRIAEARLRIDQLRLLVLRAAWLIDQGGAKNAAHRDLRHQDRRSDHRPMGHRCGYPDPRSRRADGRLPARHALGPGSGSPLRRRTRGGPLDGPGQERATTMSGGPR